MFHKVAKNAREKKKFPSFWGFSRFEFEAATAAATTTATTTATVAASDDDRAEGLNSIIEC